MNRCTTHTAASMPTVQLLQSHCAQGLHRRTGCHMPNFCVRCPEAFQVVLFPGVICQHMYDQGTCIRLNRAIEHLAKETTFRSTILTHGHTHGQSLPTCIYHRPIAGCPPLNGQGRDAGVFPQIIRPLFLHLGHRMVEAAVSEGYKCHMYCAFSTMRSDDTAPCCALPVQLLAHDRCCFLRHKRTHTQSDAPQIHAM
jgi:hypothetical protein